MMVKKQNNKNIIELQKKITQLEIKVHEKGFIHISWYGILRLIAFLSSLGLSILNFMLIISTWKMLNLSDLNVEDIINVNQILIIYPLIVEFILIGLSFICLVTLIKGGFNKLKSYDEKGLIFGLIVGLIVGLIFGLIFCLIVGLIFGMIFGMIFCMIFGLIFGLFEEFN